MLRAALISVAIVVLFGVFLPLRKGPDFLDPLILGGCLMLSLIIVAPAAASAFSGGEPAEGRAALRRLGVLVLYAWSMGAAIVGAGLVTVNMRSHYRHALLPDSGYIAAALVCSGAATMFMGLLSALVARRYSATVARNALRLVVLGIVLFVFAMARFGGPNWLQSVHLWCTTSHLRALALGAAGVLAIADALLGFVLVRGAAPAVTNVGS